MITYKKGTSGHFLLCETVRQPKYVGQVLGGAGSNKCYEPLVRFIGISHKHWNNDKIMGDKSAIIPLDIRNGVILTSKG